MNTRWEGKRWDRWLRWLSLVCLSFLWMRPVCASPEWPNEPPGSTFITENPWMPGYFPCSGCVDAYGWGAGYGKADIVTTPLGLTPPMSNPYTLHMQIDPSLGADNGPDIVGYPIHGLRELYTGMYFLIPSNWSNAEGIKLFLTFLEGGTDWSGWVVTLNNIGGQIAVNYYMPGGASHHNCDLAGAEGSDCSSGSGSGSINLTGNVISNYVVSLGQWHRIEQYIKVPTTASSEDGIIKVWVDGTLVMNYTTVDIGSEAVTTSEFHIANTYHGIPNGTYHIYYDNVRLSQPNGMPSDLTPPSIPTMNPPSVVSSSQINLAWTASTDTGGSGLAGYHLERCQGATCTTFTEIASLAAPTTSYPNTGLTANTTYRYRVRALDNANLFSGYSTIASAITRGDLTGDGKVDLEDLRTMIYMLIGQVQKDLVKADLDGDGQLLLLDLQALVRILVGLP